MSHIVVNIWRTAIKISEVFVLNGEFAWDERASHDPPINRVFFIGNFNL